jgi:hypothetical protein
MLLLLVVKQNILFAFTIHHNSFPVYWPQLSQHEECQLALFGYPDGGFSVLFLSCKANARVKPAKMGHGPY